MIDEQNRMIRIRNEIESEKDAAKGAAVPSTDGGTCDKLTRLRLFSATVQAMAITGRWR